ncbi:MAG: nitroreductase family protein [Myxococcaceae bacterium]
MPTKNSPTVFDAISGRRAIRSFMSDVLDERTVRRLLEAAVQAPTAMHLEPWAFLVIQDKGLLRNLSERAKALWPAELTQQQRHHQATLPETSGFAQRLADPDFNLFYDAGTLIAIGSIVQGVFAQADCWLAAENLMLEAYALGLGTCCIGSAVGALNSQQTRLELDLPAEFSVVAPIIVGVPREVPAQTPRKPPRVVRWRKSNP